MSWENSTPDGVVRLYFCSLEKAQNLVDEYARVYAKVCGECDSREREIGAATGEQICANHRCGAKWPFDLAPVPRGIVQCSPRPSRVDEKAVRMAPAGIAINGMLADETWRWPMQALIAHAVTSATREEISRHARAHGWPGRAWTPGSTAWAIRHARGELMRRLGLSF